MRLLAIELVLLAIPAGGLATDHPSAPFANEHVEAVVYLPDPESGYYRGTRFDRSSAIDSLKYSGQVDFGE